MIVVAPSAAGTWPLDRMAECHERLARECADLRRLLRAGPRNSEREALAAVMHYLEHCAPQHYADEEEDLFPALIESMAGSDAVCLRDLTESLASDHRLLRAAWTRLRFGLERVLQGDADALRLDDVEAFIELQSIHDEREDAELLPMAARLLDPQALAQIGLGMDRRRAAGRTQRSAQGAFSGSA